MKPNLQYLRYVVRHKWFVLLAGLKLGVPFHQLILHDWHKFLPGEWQPYVDHFYRKPRTGGREGYYHNPDDAEIDFNTAWLKHLNRAPHHWQHWIITLDSGPTFCIPMPERFVREMVADWSGAGRAQGHGNDVSPWYERNQARMQMHRQTRTMVEELVRQTRGWS